MKNAKEMFEELGYTFQDYSNLSYNSRFQYEILDEKWHEFETVYFMLEDKTISINSYLQEVGINMTLFKAIQKQIEELGWLE